MQQLPPPNWVLRTAIGPAILAGQLAVRSTAQHQAVPCGHFDRIEDVDDYSCFSGWR